MESAAQYGCMRWFEAQGIHPDDLEVCDSIQAYRSLVYCWIGTEGEYLVLGYGDIRIRMKPEGFHPVRGPQRRIGEKVRIVRSKEGVVLALIRDVMWHYERQEPFYFVTAQGKKLTKRNWESDFASS